MSDGNGRFTAAPRPANSAAAVAAQFVDYDNDGLLDLVVLSARALHVFRNLGPALGGASPSSRARRPKPAPSRRWRSAISTPTATTTSSSGWRPASCARGATTAAMPTGRLRVQLTGRVSNRSGVGSKVDLRAGSLRQRLETLRGDTGVRARRHPLRPRLAHGRADVVRVLWPSGMLQAEIDTGAGGAAAQPLAAGTLLRSPSSIASRRRVPFLYTWNGTRSSS